MIAAGVDVGSRTIKVAILRRGVARPLACRVADQGVDQKKLVAGTFAAAREEAGVTAAEITGVVATGYGRKAVGFADRALTEITCLTRAAHALAPGASTVIDIGGQDSKLLWLDPDGTLRDFVMNDRCAAGTGRFLELVAVRLGIGLADLGRLGTGSMACPLTSTCAVFAESEITGLLASGVEASRIAAAVMKSVVERLASMAGHREWGPALFTGGVALVPGMRRALETFLGTGIAIPRYPQEASAIGAALIALGEGAEGADGARGAHGAA